MALVSCASSRDLPGVAQAPILDTAEFAVWQTRGGQVGRLAQRYCIAAGERQRAWMREAIALEAHPATVTITCATKETAP